MDKIDQTQSIFYWNHVEGFCGGTPEERGVTWRAVVDGTGYHVNGYRHQKTNM